MWWPMVTLAAGAAYGRFVGEVTNRIVALTGSDIEIVAGGYAVVGAWL